MPLLTKILARFVLRKRTMSYLEVSPTKFILSSICTPHAVKDETAGFQVAWKINPHMKVGSSSLSLAIKEHERFKTALLLAGAEILSVPFVRGAYDSVFMKDNALLVEKDQGFSALMGTPKTRERQKEQFQRALSLRSLGINVESKTQKFFEGGDLVLSAAHRLAFLGYGFRTQASVKEELEEFLGFPVTTLELVDPHFYHLDTAFNITATEKGRVAFACRKAFSSEAWSVLENHPDLDYVIEIPEPETMSFGLNWVEVNGTVILGSDVPTVKKNLEKLGKNVLVTPLTQFQLAGGSAACLVAPIHRLGNYSALVRPERITVHMPGLDKVL